MGVKEGEVGEEEGVGLPNEKHKLEQREISW
jgi:hypothetical protein